MLPSGACGAILVGLVTLGLTASAPIQRWRDTPDFPASDPAKDIADALAAGARDGKRVLLDFGADWCVDCKVLEQTFRDPTVAKFLNEHFHVVRIDLGVYFEPDKIKNADTAAKYGVGTAEVGIPALVLLDVRGRVIKPEQAVAWRTASHFTAPEVLRYLTELADAR